MLFPFILHISNDIDDNNHVHDDDNHDVSHYGPSINNRDECLQGVQREHNDNTSQVALLR